MPNITAVHGDITQQQVDAIVNAANNAMRGGGDGAIHRAGGPAGPFGSPTDWPPVTRGWTTAGELPARWVIHTVGPNYRVGQRDGSVLASCYRRVLELADEFGALSVAFPLISSGVYGWPRQDAIGVVVDTIAGTATRVAEARIVAFDAETYDEVNKQLSTTH